MHMVQSGIMRAFGGDLRRRLGTSLGNRFKAFMAGLGVTALLQSSTATALMATSFAASGVIDLTPALAVMLGANVGTTLIVQVLSFNLSWLSPALIIIGVVAVRRGGRTRTRDVARVSIGLGLILLALQLMLAAFAPAESAPALRAVLSAATNELVLDLLIAAALTWATHSSVTVVLFVMSLATAGVITPAASLALVLGANLGSAINPVIEGARSASAESRRLAIGNLANRFVGCLLALPFLHPIAEMMARLDGDPARLAANFHTLFNLVLAALFMIALKPYARLLTRMLPAAATPADPATPLYLDPEMMETPSRESLDESDSRRAMEIIAFAINLEHIGDIIDKNLMELAGKKIKNRLKFSGEGAAELVAFHQSVVDTLKLALGVFMSGDVKIARRILEEKTLVRAAERAAAENHLIRLREGRLESIETSALHLDILRDLKRIHSHLCSVAYPVLESTGELQPSRLRKRTRREPAARAAAAAPEAPTPRPT